MQGNLGKLVALIGIALAFVTWIFGTAIRMSGGGGYEVNSGTSSMAIKIAIIGIIAGGIVGIATSFFNLGSVAFTLH